MNFKKIMALCLALAMMLSCFSFTAMAAEKTVSTIADLQTAVNNATDGDVIVIDGTIEIKSGADRIYVLDKDITIKGGTIDITDCKVDGDTIIGVGSYTYSGALTLSGVKIIGKNYSPAYAVIYVYDGSVLNMINCEVDLTNDVSAKGTESAGGFIKAETRETTVNIKSSTINLTDAQRPFWQIGNINIDNSKINYTATADAAYETSGLFRQTTGIINDTDITVDGEFEAGKTIINLDRAGDNLTLSGMTSVTATNYPGNIVKTANSKIYDATLTSALAGVEGVEDAKGAVAVVNGVPYFSIEDAKNAGASEEDIVEITTEIPEAPALHVADLVGTQLDIGDYTLDTGVKLTARETEEDLENSPYRRNYGVDFELSFDKDTTAILAGSYPNWEDGKWVALAGAGLEDFGIDEDGYAFEANKPIRVMGTAIDILRELNMYNSKFGYISYAEVVSFVKQFKCGVKVTGDEDVTATLKLVLFPVEVVDEEEVFGRAIEVYTDSFEVKKLGNVSAEEKVEFINNMGVDVTNAEEVATEVANMSNEDQMKVDVDVYGKIAGSLTEAGDALVAGDKGIEVSVEEVVATENVTNAILLNGEVHEVTVTETVNGEEKEVTELDYPVIVKITGVTGNVKTVLHDHNGVIETLDFWQDGDTVYVKMHKFSQISLIMGASVPQNEALLTAVLSETSDNKAVYDIVLEADDLDTIKGVVSGEFKVSLAENAGTAEIDVVADTNVVITPKGADFYEFYVTKEATDSKYFTENILEGKIKLGTITVTGSDEENENGAEGTIDFAEALIAKGFIGTEGYSNTMEVLTTPDSVNYFIPTPKKTLTIVLDMRHGVGALTGMELTVTGGAEVNSVDLNTYKTPVGGTIEPNHTTYTYEVKVTKGGNYAVKISGKGYRSFTQAGIDMTKDTTVKLWNSYIDNDGTAEVVVGDSNTAVNRNFLAGDIIDDGVVNKFDLSAVVSYTGTAPTTETLESDINRDGVINSLDTAIVVYHMGK